MDKYRVNLMLMEDDLRVALSKDYPLETRLHRLTVAVAQTLSILKQLTTAETIPTAPMKDSPQDVEVSTTAPTLPSSLSAQVDTPSGPVGPHCRCVEQAQDPDFNFPRYAGRNWVQVRCANCGAYVSYVRTPVPAAPTASSTSPKQGLNKSVGSLAEESVMYGLKDLRE